MPFIPTFRAARRQRVTRRRRHFRFVPVRGTRDAVDGEERVSAGRRDEGARARPARGGGSARARVERQAPAVGGQRLPRRVVVAAATGAAVSVGARRRRRHGRRGRGSLVQRGQLHQTVHEQARRAVAPPVT